MGFWKHLLSAHVELSHNLEQIDFDVETFERILSQSQKEVGPADLGDVLEEGTWPTSVEPWETWSWRKGLVSGCILM